MAQRNPKSQKQSGPRRRTAAKRKESPLSLVTGACGFIGTTMVEVLHEAGHRIRATDLASAYERDDRTKGRFPSVVKNLGVEFVPSDMTRPETLSGLLDGVNYVFHIAAVFNYSAPWKTLKAVNIEGTRSLCTLLLQAKDFEKLVLWGAGGVYGFPPAEFLPIKEEDPKAPPNNYLKSKHEQEQLVMALGRTHGLRYSIVRPTGVYGPRCVYGMGQMIMTVAQQKRLAIPRNFTTRVPLVHVRDVCSAALFLATHREADSEACNLNDDTQMTLVEFFQFMGEILNKPVTLLPPFPIWALRSILLAAALVDEQVSRRFLKSAPHLERDTINFLGKDISYSNQKLKDLGYRFLYPDARVGLRETVEWYRNQGWI
jgi:nucleoside-diphosphate-sugar epimerase